MAEFRRGRRAQIECPVARWIESSLGLFPQLGSTPKALSAAAEPLFLNSN
jgi:hypothetical protein